jgi:hypothetical protein
MRGELSSGDIMGLDDEGLEEIFGTPNKTIDYANSLTENGRKRWQCGYWWKFDV